MSSLSVSNALYFPQLYTIRRESEDAQVIELPRYRKIGEKQSREINEDCIATISITSDRLEFRFVVNRIHFPKIPPSPAEQLLRFLLVTDTYPGGS